MANIEKREITTRKGKEVSYKVTVLLGRENGQRIRKSRTYHVADLKHTSPTAQYKEVQELAEAWEKELKGQKTFEPKRADKVLFQDIIPEFKKYINDLKNAGELARRTAADYINICESYCLPYFTGKTIESIDNGCADDFLKYLRDEKKLAPSSRKKILATMRKVFKYLIDDARIASDNPFRDSEIVDKKGKTKSKIGQSWNKEQIELFSKILTSETEYYYGKRTRKTAEGKSYEVGGYTRMIKISPMWVALFLTAITCGFRPGELRGLTWKDIDFESVKIHIKQAISSIPGEEDEISSTKSVSGIRTVTPSNAAMEALISWREEQEQLAATSQIWKGKKIIDFDEQLVFCSVDGSILDKGTINRKFHNIIDRWNSSIMDLLNEEEDTKKSRDYKKMLLPRIRAYDLRHTYGTIETEEGTPANILAGKMGHATPTTTFNNYVHPSQQVYQDDPNKFNEIISSSKNEIFTDKELAEMTMIKKSINLLLGNMTMSQLEQVYKYVQQLEE